MKYLNDLYHVIWKDGKLIEPEPDPTEEEMRKIKEEALQKMLDFLPCKLKFSFFIQFILLGNFKVTSFSLLLNKVLHSFMHSDSEVLNK